MQTKEIKVNLNNNDRAIEKLEGSISSMIGVNELSIDPDAGIVTVSFETPANLNAIEKEIYDQGHTVLY
ncbi:heavy-metal-associated domain-containing protein [Staphylococcus sp. SQ8-PEA]|uniref:Heavy-metal-associated domain-containing protein n=1 Tax=Staphylococcus marylandisciuri TaxID=2981529 RepID=A0ABT2QRD7_9STAP|nr:cation transporter [Staphylococcus marylandisciuri]MCU5746553.1 heavy-metal-associated domain-containing protein [Staphylococcus marylandisciuri]